MATVHLGRLIGPVGFSRTVAIKRLHPQYAQDAEFSAMFLDEARIAARVRHPNVAATLDVIATKQELFLVMEYVEGETLSRLLAAAQRAGLLLEPRVVSAIMSGVLLGLHAAHTATSESGESLLLVHRDVSPQNVLVGVDGVSRIVDFGIAKAVGRSQSTREGQIKGKAAYMAPEQVRGTAVDRRTDVYAAGVVLWEALTGRRLFAADTPLAAMMLVVDSTVAPPSAYADVSAEVDAVVLRAISKEAARRYGCAADFAAALEQVLPPASPREVGALVRALASESLQERAQRVAEIETGRSLPDARISELPPPADEPTTRATALQDTRVETPRTTLRWLPVSVLVAVGAVFVVIYVSANARREHKAEGAAEQVSSAATLSSQTAAASSSTPMAWSAPSVDDGGSSQPSNTAPASSTSNRRASPRVIRAPVSVAPARATATPCNPPYTVDPQGVHIPKAECF
jgi:serine/threonine protein kinase